MKYKVEICVTHYHIAEVDLDSEDITRLINAAVIKWGELNTQEDYDREAFSIGAIYDENNNKVWGR